MIVITIIEQGKMQYRPTLISNLYSHLNKHRLMSIFRDIMALLVSIYRDCIFLISPSTNVDVLHKFGVISPKTSPVPLQKRPRGLGRSNRKILSSL